MTRLQKEIDDLFNAFLLPPRFAKTFTNVVPSYPPYNIVRKSETEILLEMAVAGFKESEINVVVEDDHLKVTGRKEDTDGADYIYKGIGTRAFEKSFLLSKEARVDSASYNDGVLSVLVIYEIPEEKKPKQIPISRGEKVLLVE